MSIETVTYNAALCPFKWQIIYLCDLNDWLLTVECISGDALRNHALRRCGIRAKIKPSVERVVLLLFRIKKEFES